MAKIDRLRWVGVAAIVACGMPGIAVAQGEPANETAVSGGGQIGADLIPLPADILMPDEIKPEAPAKPAEPQRRAPPARKPA